MIYNIKYINKKKKETCEVVIVDEIYVTEHSEIDNYVFRQFNKNQLYGHISMFKTGLRYSYIVLEENKNVTIIIAGKLRDYLIQNGVSSIIVKSILLWKE